MPSLPPIPPATVLAPLLSLFALSVPAHAQSLQFGPVPGLPPGAPPAATTCVASAPPPVAEVGGRIVLQITVRKHRVSLATATSTDPAVAPLAACFERELVGWTWPTRRARVDVPIVLDPAEPPPAEPAAPDE